jgi:hypothetical protein
MDLEEGKGEKMRDVVPNMIIGAVYLLIIWVCIPW